MLEAKHWEEEKTIDRDKDDDSFLKVSLESIERFRRFFAKRHTKYTDRPQLT